MKSQTVRFKTLAFTLLVGICGLSHAHDQGGVLASSPYATQSWLITCYDDGNGPAASLYFDVKASTSGRKFGVTATLTKNSQEASTTDPKSGDKIRSPGTFLIAGDGEYIMTLSKVKTNASSPESALKGTMVYGFTYHCESAGGAHTGTQINRW